MPTETDDQTYFNHLCERYLHHYANVIWPCCRQKVAVTLLPSVKHFCQPPPHITNILLSPVHCLWYGIPQGSHPLPSPLPSASMPPLRIPPLFLQGDALDSTTTGPHFHRLICREHTQFHVKPLSTVSSVGGRIATAHNSKKNWPWEYKVGVKKQYKGKVLSFNLISGVCFKQQ